jgi:hypothetical protein
MGSTNTGRFTDYPQSARLATQAAGDMPAESAGGGGAGERDVCAEAFVNHELLEEVARCAYFERTGDVPPVGTDVYVLPDLQGGRLAVATRSDGEVLGLLTTRWNVLLACMQDGWRYEGEVVATLREKMPLIRVDLRPVQ